MAICPSAWPLEHMGLNCVLVILQVSVCTGICSNIQQVPVDDHYL